MYTPLNSWYLSVNKSKCLNFLWKRSWFFVKLFALKMWLWVWSQEDKKISIWADIVTECGWWKIIWFPIESGCCKVFQKVDFGEQNNLFIKTTELLSIRVIFHSRLIPQDRLNLPTHSNYTSILLLVVRKIFKNIKKYHTNPWTIFEFLISTVA